MDFLLSILIPTLPERRVLFSSLFARLAHDASYFGGEEVEILIDNRPARKRGGPTIAAKRNALYQRAKGRFSIQIDDDDDFTHSFIERVLRAIKENPDAHAIEYDILVKAHNSPHSLANVSINNKEWRHNLKGRYKYYQPIYYKVPILTSICQQCKMDESQIWREDADFAQKVKRHIRKSYRINEALYIYNDPGNVKIHDRY